MISNFDLEIMKLAFKEAENSLANKRKVGAVIVVNNNDNYNQTFGPQMFCGYNKMFQQLKVSPTCENEFGETFECVIHAEEMAIMTMLKTDIKKTSTIYVTYSPCMNCCKLIAHAGITRVVYYDVHHINFNQPEIKGGYSPANFLEQMGIVVERIYDLNILDNNEK